MSEFGARKGLLIEKAPAEKMEDIEMPQIHLAPWIELGVFVMADSKGSACLRAPRLKESTCMNLQQRK